MKSPKNFGLDLSQVAVVLVGRLGQAGHVGLFGHRLAIRHHWVAHNEVTLGILVLPWANPRFQNHPRLVENLDWMIPIGPSWVKRNAIFWGAIFIYICIYGGFRSQKNTLLFCMKKEKKLTARLKSASPRAKQTYNQRKDDKEHFAMFQTYMIDLNSFTSFTKQTKSHQLPQSTFFLTKHPNLQVNRRVKNLPSPNRV